MCIQETHSDRHHERLRIDVMCLTVERSYSKHGSVVFTRLGITVKSTSYAEEDSIEIISIELDRCTVISTYNPLNWIFKFKQFKNFISETINIVVRNFSGMSINWSYTDTDKSGESVDSWINAST